MPRGFLVKRTKHSGAISYRVRHNSEEDRSDSGSEHDFNITKFGSPDSGYSASPINHFYKELQNTENDNHLNNNNNVINNNNNINNNNDKSNIKNNEYHAEKDFVSFTPVSSPLTVRVSTNSYPSPFYYSTFDQLSVSNNSPINLSEKAKTPSSAQSSPNKRRGNSEGETKSKTPKKPKAARKINFDEDKSSPVSGCIIKDLSDTEDDGKVVYGDIDSVYNFVEVTPEARAELEKIENKIGDYICQLCKEFFEDAFQLAQHRCSRIIHVEYRCPECDKVFNCPANLASHRRWHKPRPNPGVKTAAPAHILPANPNKVLNENSANLNSLRKTENCNVLNLTPSDLRNSPTDEGQFECEKCGKKFRRQAYLKKHVLNHSTDTVVNCAFCERVFQNENAKSKHEQLHLTNGKDVNCMICNLPFNNKIALEKHMRSHSTEIYTCKYCSNSFYSSPGLTRHINKCHPSENRQVILLNLPPQAGTINRPC